jgi:ribose transport system substrate-binding protein
VADLSFGCQLAWLYRLLPPYLNCNILQEFTPLRRTAKPTYLIPVLSKAFDVLELLQADNQPTTMESLYKRTRISKTTVYRILKTLVHRGYAMQMPDGNYRHITKPKKLRFGFGSQSADEPFSNAVTRSMQDAASAAGVELIILDNQYDAATAVRNAEEFVRLRVDLVIEFQVEQAVAPVVGDCIAAANIPLIAIDIPHPHGTFFGVDNYRVGLEAGELLAAHAIAHWGGKVDWVIGLDLPEAGPLVQSRITGAFASVRKSIANLPEESFVHIDGRGKRERSRKAVSDFLQRHVKDKRILIAAATDSSALGALDAARELKRESHVAIVGQDYIEEAAEEIAKRNSSMIGSVSHEAHLYGAHLIQLGLAVIQGQTIPPYNYALHRMVTRDSPKP